MKPKWSQFHDTKDLKAALLEAIPSNSSMSDVQKLLHDWQLTCSEPTNNVIYCSIELRSWKFFIKRKWLLEFEFDEEKLVNLEVRTGLIGP